jgi:hypothetical protein
MSQIQDVKYPSKYILCDRCRLNIAKIKIFFDTGIIEYRCLVCKH